MNFIFVLLMVLHLCETSKEILFKEFNDVINEDINYSNTKNSVWKIKKHFRFIKQVNNNINKRPKRNIVKQTNCDANESDFINSSNSRNSGRLRRFLTNLEKEKNCSSEVKFLDTMPTTTTTSQFLEQKETTSSVSIPGFLTSNFNETNYNAISTSSSTTVYNEEHRKIQRNFKFNEVTRLINPDVERNVTLSKSRILDFKFLDVPPGGGMTIPELALDDDGYILFGLISSVIDGMQTADFPAALIKDWILDRLSFAQLIIQTVRVEGGIIACVIVFVISAMMLPFAVLAHTSCRFGSDEETPPPNEFSETQMQCRKLVLIAVLDLIIILFPLGIIGMFFSNEHLTRSVLHSQQVVKSVIDDTNTFVRNSHLQIRFVATTTMDEAIDATIANLEDVENLLGRPIQKELATETGIDIALDALLDICSVSTDIATDVLALRTEAQAARETARTSQDRLKDLQKQVDIAKRCVDRDRILCDTIDTDDLHVIFNVDKLLAERKLAKLRHLGEDNLTSAANDARKSYQNIPQRIVSDTAFIRQEIKMILRKHREQLYSASDALEEVSHNFLASIDIANNYVSKTVEAITSIEQWRWLTGLVASLSMLIIWVLLVIGAACIHTNCSNKIFPLLLTLVILICTLSMLLWILSSITIFSGGSGQILLCKPLYDDPNFASITLLLDNPGMIYNKGGLFSNIMKGNNSIDVPVKVVLSDCRLSRPVFPIFNLNRIFNIDYLTNHPRWPNLHSYIHNISSTININDTQILKPTLQKYLQDISSASRVNLTYYRSQLSGPLTQTDLNTFADQLERIAGQIADVQTQARMETLAARARKLLANNLQRLEKHRDEIVYKLTALELKLLPLQRQANQSLSHLKTIQFYFLNQGSHISEIKSKEYVTRLLRYLEKFREHVLNQLSYEVAPCRPLWDIFAASRTQICKNIIDPLNGFWASTVWCLLLFFILTPVLMSLIGYQRYITTNGELRRDVNELLITNQGPWTTPNSTPESVISAEQSTWPSPSPRRQPFIPAITVTRQDDTPPQPPRKLIGRRTPRGRLHESLKMIEPNTSKSANSFNIPSPRRWL